MAYDIDAGQELMDRFNAPFDRLIWYYESMITAAAGDDRSLASLREAAMRALDDIRDRQ
jgi:hypothetical protein